MNGDLHRHLDGELRADALSPTDRSAADAWERMLGSFRSASPHAPAPRWLEQRVMSEIHAIPRPGLLARAATWLLRPRSVRLSPLVVGLVTIVIAIAIVRPRDGVDSTDSTPAVASAGATSIVYVQFVLDAPAATSVAVAGDFSEWQPAFTLEDVDGDGVWTGRVPVEPGVHGYMFLIDGTRWQTDPHADRYRDDGFGNRNAVLAVPGE